MTLIEAHRKLISFGQPFLHSTDVAAFLGISRGLASKIMTRLSKAGFTIPLTRGRWAMNREVDIFMIPEFLTAPSPSYISLQSALFFHGMISQIPETVYAVSTSRARLYKTAIGVFSIHHVDSDFLYGFETTVPGQMKIATPEKALVDFFYLSPAKSKLFHALPEIELPKNFRVKQALEMVSGIKSKSRRTIVTEKIYRVLR